MLSNVVLGWESMIARTRSVRKATRVGSPQQSWPSMEVDSLFGQNHDGCSWKSLRGGPLPLRASPSPKIVYDVASGKPMAFRHPRPCSAVHHVLSARQAHRSVSVCGGGGTSRASRVLIWPYPFGGAFQSSPSTTLKRLRSSHR
jgi:hypothetical protein